MDVSAKLLSKLWSDPPKYFNELECILERKTDLVLRLWLDNRVRFDERKQFLVLHLDAFR